MSYPSKFHPHRTNQISLPKDLDMRSLHRVRVSCLLLVSAFVISRAATPAYAQQRTQLDLNHIPDVAVGAVFAFPAQLKANPNLEMLPYEIISAAGRQELGFDPMDIQQALLVIAPAEGPEPFVWGVSLLFEKPQILSENITKNLTPAEFQNVAYLKADYAEAPSFCVIDGTRVLIAPEGMLQQMIVARNGKSQLKQLLTETEGDSDLTAIVAFTPLRPMAEAGMQALPALPPQLQGLTGIPSQLKSVKLRLNIANEKESELILTAEDADQAIVMQQAIQEAMGFAKQIILMQATANMGGNDPVEQATGQYTKRMIDTFEKRLQPVQEQDRVTISIKNFGPGYAPTAVMAALLLPAVQQAREAARRTQSRNSLRQIAIAMHNYHDAHRSFPARAIFDEEGKPLLSWRVHLLPFLDQQKLYDQFHLDEAWDSPHNKKLIAQMPAVYANPNLVPGENKTNYLLLTGESTAFEDEEGPTLRAITDGSSNTIMAVEANADQAVVWTKPDDLEFDPKKPLAGLGQLRDGGFNIVLFDGSSRFVSNNTDLDVLRGMATMAGGEVIQLP